MTRSRRRRALERRPWNVIFTLKTKHNLSGDFKNINIGDTVTWRGERVSADDSSETWLITSIDKIEER